MFAAALAMRAPGPAAVLVALSTAAQARGDARAGAAVRITGEAGNDPRSYRVDFSRAREELGFEAQWTVADGATELHKAYTEFGLTERAFHDDFTRLAVLKELQAGGAIDASMRRR